MSKPYLDQLKKGFPGFKEDRDDDWVVYVPKEDQTRLRNWREKFQHMLEELDEIKLDRASLSQEKSFTEEINKFIKDTLLVHLPRMKETAIKIRDEAIQEDFTPTKRPRLGESSTDAFISDEAEYLPFDFLPSAMTKEKSKSPESKKKKTAEHKKKSKKKSAKSNKPDGRPVEKPVELTRDTYLDDVTDEFYIKVLKTHRPQIERYSCKDRVIDALNSFKRYRDTKYVFDAISSIVNKSQASK